MQERGPGPLSMIEHCLTPLQEQPDRVALRVATGVRDGQVEGWSWTGGEVLAAVERCAALLLGQGLRPGDRVLLRVGNRAAFPLAFFGAIGAGLVAVPVSDQLIGPEATWALADSGAAAVVHDPALPIDLPPDLPRVLADEVETGRGARVALVIGAPPDDPAYLTYTSGTTGRPKGVLHAQRSAWGRRPMIDGWHGQRGGDVVLHAGALSWTYTLGVGLIDPWSVGAEAVVYAGPRDGLVWPDLVAASGASVFAAVPGVYRHLLRHGDPSTWRLDSLRHGLVAGEALSPALRQEWLEATGIELYEALGMSEISTFVSSGPATPVRPGSPGRAQPGRRVAALDPGDLRPLPPGETGRLAVHRSDPGLMLGYWQRPAETEEVLRGEWFVTSDLVSLDADGYVWHHGRADDVMTAMGYRVSPVEVEEALAGAPGVADVGVRTVEHGDGVAIITAFVVPGPDGVDESAVLAHARARLARYKCPREVRVVAELPRTANGKLIRRDLA